MRQIEQDLIYLRSTVPELEEYLLSDVLFWPLSLKGKDKAPPGATQLTIGNVLLSLKRLEAAAESRFLDGDDLSRLAASIDLVRGRWKSNWNKKSGKEIASRLRQWDQYVSELSSGEGRRGDYPYNIRLRVMLGLLMAEMDHPSVRDRAQLDTLDQRLRNVTRPAAFVWDTAIQAGFPREEYWYLYREPA